eukprot:TRINITY_DN2513_c0_g1_i5.p2 TRINITY_DN2513_c0_g1~~TRINITY_DN2513_c0_g1_i5.p2  ORF type:complete len:121 (+),score=8.60 TRINITY_DN2513_c0_g1_i5:540-902(+)
MKSLEKKKEVLCVDTTAYKNINPLCKINAIPGKAVSASEFVNQFTIAIHTEEIMPPKATVKAKNKKALALATSEPESQPQASCLSNADLGTKLTNIKAMVETKPGLQMPNVIVLSSIVAE